MRDVRDNVPAPAYKDADGPWWENSEIAHWWVRPRDWVHEGEAGYEARHRHGYIDDVAAPSMYLLAIFTWQAQIRHVLRQRETSAA